MSAAEFFDLLLEELKQNENLRGYYRFLNGNGSFLFRKAHFIQRLQFIERNVGTKEQQIWDCGCGYGTTAIFLALNGYQVYGNTLEYYFEQIPKRMEYWSKYGKVNTFTFGYENIFDKHPAANSIDTIIVQDTLHHLEPIDKAIELFANCLKSNGKVLASEVNGSNLFERTKFFMQRGNKRVIEMYDEKLKKKILFGNENIRNAQQWRDLFSNAHFQIDESKIEYIRFFMPYRFSEKSYDALLASEQKLWRKNAFLKKYFFFGINFIANKK